MTNRLHQRSRSRFPTTWEEYLALAPGDPFQVFLSPGVLLDDGQQDEPEADTLTSQPHPRTRQGHPVALVRGVLAQRVVVSTELDPFLDLKALSKYSDLSVRKLRGCLADPAHPLPHYRVGGKILVRRSEFDIWVTRYRQVGNPDVEQIVNDVLKSL